MEPAFTTYSPVKKRRKCNDAHCGKPPVGSVVENPTTLFQTCIEYIARNIHMVESLYGFPDIVGFKIFQFAKDIGKFNSVTTQSLSAMELFCEAYGSDVLSCLTLRCCHIGIADYLDHLCLFTHLVELDIGQCGLGDDHELLQHIGQLNRLKKLCLCENGLSDKGVQRMTIPLRIFKRGPVSLHTLDLSENREITHRVARYLRCFDGLLKLNVSGTSILPCDEEKLEADLQMLSVLEQSIDDCCKTENKGWASDVVCDWMSQSARLIKAAKIETQTSKFYNRKAKLLSALNRDDNNDCTSIPSKKSFLYFVRKENCVITNIYSSYDFKKSLDETLFTPAAKCSDLPFAACSSTKDSSKLTSRKQEAQTLRQKVTIEESDEDICNLYASQSTPHHQNQSLSDFLSTW
ncbi:leucine-rich repeat-containing protein 42-like [Liolophura sinensis]|uniref:leucine-rich repeat-containing protein 42-like n=1 Tax=Liolophura sinensis TaxID=3198878 RepID=UPI00315956D5